MQVQAKVQVFEVRDTKNPDWKIVKLLLDHGDGIDALDCFIPAKGESPRPGQYVAEFRIGVREKRAQLELVKLLPAASVAKAA